MSSRDSQVERRVTEVFERARRIEVHTDPYLETRVLARLRETRRTAKLVWWRRLSLAGSTVTAAVAVVFLIAQHKGFDSFLVRPQTVKMGAFEPVQKPAPVVDKSPLKADEKLPVKKESKKKSRK